MSAVQVWEPQGPLSSPWRRFTLIWSSSFRMTPAVCCWIYAAKHAIQGADSNDWLHKGHYECVLVRAGVLVHSSQTINTPSALIMIAMGNQISGCHLRCGPAFRFLVGKQPRQHEVYIWCLSIISCGKGSIIFARCVPTSGEMWNLKASTVEHNRGCLIVLDLRASLRNVVFSVVGHCFLLHMDCACKWMNLWLRSGLLSTGANLQAFWAG